MNDLIEYFSLQDKVASLERELIEVRKTLMNERYNKSYYKTRYEKIVGKKDPTRTDKALEAILSLETRENPTKKIRYIAKKFFLSESHVSDIWYKHAK